ncbi:uncharacterized protein LOC134197497 isoform X2 [Corticium candelabrum]|nr:uncharacterized protein LOC134197497 isoform X2 [Corticium candelabrum]
MRVIMLWMSVYMAVSLVSLAETSTALGGSSTHHSVAENLVRMATSLTSFATSEIDSRRASEHTQMASDLGQHARTMRLSEYSPYSSNPYDLGPINQCSYPQLHACNFESGYTVPEYAARVFRPANSILNDLHEKISSGLSSRCTKSWMNFMCKALVGPRCISNTTVRYQTNNYDICRQVFSSCPLRSTTSSIFCQTLSSIITIHPAGTFSLTSCRVLNIDGCANTLPSPDWLAALLEHQTQSSSFDDRARALSLSGSCKINYIKLSCTQPTCGSNGRLQGYDSSSQCHNIANCVRVGDSQKLRSKCDDLERRKHSSVCAGETESCTSGATSTTYYVGISIAWSMLALIKNCL